MVTHQPRKTRFRLLVRLYRTGLVTRRVPSERFQASGYPPLPSFFTQCRFIFSGKNDELTPGGDDRVDTVQNQVIADPFPKTLETIFRLKRSAVRLQKIFNPQREVLNRLARDPYKPIQPRTGSTFAMSTTMWCGFMTSPRVCTT